MEVGHEHEIDNEGTDCPGRRSHVGWRGTCRGRTPAVIHACVSKQVDLVRIVEVRGAVSTVGDAPAVERGRPVGPQGPAGPPGPQGLPAIATASGAGVPGPAGPGGPRWTAGPEG